DDRLISALQLEDRSAALGVGMSGAMIDRVVAEANRITAGLKFSSVVRMRGMWRVWTVALAAMLLLGTLAVLRPDVMDLWFRRNILLADVDWPQNTYLSVYCVDRYDKLQPMLEVDRNGNVLHLSETVEVLRGEDLEVVIASAGAAPDHLRRQRLRHSRLPEPAHAPMGPLQHPPARPHASAQPRAHGGGGLMGIYRQQKTGLTVRQKGGATSHAAAALARQRGEPAHRGTGAYMRSLMPYGPSGPQPRTCLYPLWGDEPGAARNGRSCGEPAVRGSYCADHYAECHKPIRLVNGRRAGL
ncbi:hypothetical protein LCGC14_2296230, partial [marine sediment metagenome]